MIIVIATVVIAIATIAQACIYFRQAQLMRLALDETRRSADADRRTFLSTHRPRLTIRFMSMHTPVNTLGHPLKGDFRVFNIGETRARLVRHHSEILVANSLPAMAPYDGKIGTPFVNEELISGGSTPVIFPARQPRELSPAEYIDLSNRIEDPSEGGVNMYVAGWIDYVDEEDRSRRIGFCRKYNYTTKRFGKEQDEDYEYND